MTIGQRLPTDPMAELLTPRLRGLLAALRAHLETERQSIAASYCRLDRKLRPKLETMDRHGRQPYRRLVDLMRRIDAALAKDAARRQDRKRIGRKGATARA